jgi:hypothetical protein
VPTIEYLQVLPTSLYDVTGFRNRLTIAASTDVGGIPYMRDRATAFHELGAMFRLFTAGGDKDDGSVWSITPRAYEELQ